MKKSRLLGAVRPCLVSLPLLWASSVNGAYVPWVGTADYTAAPNADSSEDNAVGDFDTYDFGMGAAVLVGINGDIAVGDSLAGTFQSYVTSHELNSTGGGTAAAPNLETTGSGSGYELTIVTDFIYEITAINAGTVEFDITSGSANLWFDTTPDFDFNADTGFANHDFIISGSVSGGSGTLLSGGVLGVTSIDYMVNSYDTNVFDPDTIVGGNSVFTLQITNLTNAAFLAGITDNANSVNGTTIGGDDLLLAADGNLALQAVPVPPAVWLFGSGLIGLVGIARRKKAS